VIEQARRRVLIANECPRLGRSIASFEPHTDLIQRGKVRMPVSSADIVAKVCGLGGCNFSRPIQVPPEKTRGGSTRPTPHATGDFRSRMTMPLNAVFSSRRLSHRFLSLLIFRLLQQISHKVSLAESASRLITQYEVEIWWTKFMWHPAASPSCFPPRPASLPRRSRRAVERAPSPDAALRGPAHPRDDLRVATAHLPLDRGLA
jgi:hypothetical protein